MRWVSEEELRSARTVDLLSYLQANEPWELKRSAPGEYRTVSHGSLVISNGRWFWNRGGFGAASALDYLLKVREMDLASAVDLINGTRLPDMSVPLPVKEQLREKKTLALPTPAKLPAKMLSYLQSRGISTAVIKQCMDAGTIYEGRYQNESVCVFIGKDETGKSRFGCMRGISGSLKRDCPGSDKRYGFHIAAHAGTNGALFAFESCIDAMSHATMFPDTGGHRLALGGTSPVALLSFLERNPQTDHVSLCLDADDAGRAAAGRIHSMLAGDERFSHIAVTVDPPRTGKDYNDMLLVMRQHAHQPAGHRKGAGISL